MGFSRGDKVGGIGSGNSQVFRVGSRIHTEPEEGMLDEDEGEKDRSRRRRKD